MLIGVDIIEIERVKNAARRTPRFLERVFTNRELDYCMNKANPYASLAARFAAKEALRKLHPAFITGVRFHDLEILRGEDGRPQVYLHGAAEQRCRAENIGEISISLSHSREQAVAAAIAKKG